MVRLVSFFFFVCKVTTAILKRDDTLLIFSSDNGGTQEFGGNNSPYRGEKATNFEGGVRGIGLVHGKMVGRIGESHGIILFTSCFFYFLSYISLYEFWRQT